MMFFRRQRGTTTVEFAIVGSVFFAVLLGVIEFGRLLYTWNVLSEVTRRGVRVAAVCPLNHSAITDVALLREAGDGDSPFVDGLRAVHIELSYRNDDGDLIADPAANYTDIAFVRVAVTGFDHVALIPFVAFDRVIRAPRFEATIPRESLGVPRDGEDAVCFGTTT